MNNNLKEVVDNLVEVGATKVVKVGGCVRDELLGLKPKDVDVEVFGLSAEEIANVLSRHGRVDSVGVSFGVLKMRNANGEFDFTLPRRESKQGKGHRGFQVEVDKSMSFDEAALRRDFTVNAMGVDLVTGQLLDPHNGHRDLVNRVLRATSKYFSDDPLRPVRGMQFAARFNMTVDSSTAELCRSLRGEYKDLALERVWEEWKKWATKSVRPSAGLNFLVACGWHMLFPEVGNLFGCLQNPVWHPEGDAFVHTGFVCDEAVVVCDRENLQGDDRLVAVFAALAHDFGKPHSSQGEWPNITSRGHPEAGVPHAEAFLYRIGAPQWLVEKVKPLVHEHMAYLNCPSAKAARNLAVRLEPANMRELVNLIEADHNGRPPLPKGLPDKAVRMLELSKQENLMGGKQKALIQGKHLLEMGEKPGPLFGVVVKEAYKAQCNGQFKDLDGGLDWLMNNLERLKSNF